jgi:hypothetical protein
MRAKERFAVGVLAAVALGVRLVAVQSLDRRQLERIEQTLRQEGEAVVALADAAARNDSVPSDFPVEWHNDFLKAQTGTFVPFIVSIGPARLNSPALLYVRAAPRASHDPEGSRASRRTAAAGGDFTSYPFEEVYPVDLAPARDHPVRVARGLSLAPGEYDVIVVVRERERDDDRGRKRMAAVLRRPLIVPDFTSGELTTSSVIVADRLTVLPEPTSAGELQERPYVIAGRDIHPVVDRVFSRSEELVVVFLVYNPFVTRDKHFDLEVEYHFFRQSGNGETYFNRTEPQRFNPVSLGPHYDPSAGQPVMAGQGVPLVGFDAGDYRLVIKVTDRVSGRWLAREVTFTIRS